MNSQIPELIVSALSVFGVGVFCVWVVRLLGWGE